MIQQEKLSEIQLKLCDVLEQQLTLYDGKLYDGETFDEELYFRKVHRALDAVYREIEGIPQMTKTGRPRKYFIIERTLTNQRANAVNSR